MRTPSQRQGIELILNNTLADITWLITEPGPELNNVIIIFEEPGNKDHAKATVLINDSQYQPQKPKTTIQVSQALGNRECHVPSKGFCYAWTEVVSKILTGLGINEIRRY